MLAEDAQKVKLKIVGRAEGSEKVEMTTEASCYTENKSTYLTYEESESGLSSTQSKIIISDSLVTLSRIGDYSSTMVFEEGRASSTVLSTPMGHLEVSVFTNKLKTRITEKGVEVKLEYLLGIEGMNYLNKLTLIATKQ